MAKNKKTLDKEILNVLQNLEINDDEKTIKILMENLERNTYVKVDELFKLLGGKWNKKIKKHQFETEKILSNIISEIFNEGKSPVKNPFDFFPTPIEIVDKMINFSLTNLNQYECYDILEPSAGTARIANKLREFFNCSSIEVCEIEEKNIKFLKEENFDIIGNDFLDLSNNKYYDAIFMNPPFNINNDSQAYIKHIYKAFDLLKSGGVLISIAPISFTWERIKKEKEFTKFLIKNGGTYISNEKNSFKESKTSVDTVIIKIIKS